MIVAPEYGLSARRQRQAGRTCCHARQCNGVTAHAAIDMVLVTVSVRVLPLTTMIRKDRYFAFRGKTMKHLQSTWLVGKVRFHHAGYGVYRIRGQSSPADRLLGPHESANKAVDAAEGLGEGHAAFRIIRSSAD